jgi:polygalacturonase
MTTKGVYNILDYNAKPDGITSATDAFKNAIKDCSDNGGGIVFIPAGKFLTGPIHLKSNMTLYISAGAIVYFSQNPDDYPVVNTRWEGTQCYALSPMIYCENLENVSISGKGIFDGQGDFWWDYYRNLKNDIYGKHYAFMDEIAKLNEEVLKIAGSGGGGLHTHFTRPSLLQLNKCKNVTLDGFTVRNSAFWNTHVLYSNDITINDVKFVNPDDSPNTDGLDIDSSKGVRISNCTFDVGDDCLCVKSGMDIDGFRIGIPTEHVTITNCTMLRGHGGVVFGSEISGGIRNIVISNCIFNGTDRGIRIKSRRERGGYIENVRINNIIMEDVISPIVFNLFYKCGANPEKIDYLNSKEIIPINELTPYIKNFQISNISSYRTRSACGVFFGLPEMPMEGISLSDIYIEMDKEGQLDTPAMNFDNTKMIKGGFTGSYLKDFRFQNITIKGLIGPAIDISNAKGIEISGIKVEQEKQSHPIIKTSKCDDVNIYNTYIDKEDIVEE